MHLWFHGRAAKASVFYNTSFGVVIFARWVKLLFSLCQFQFAGQRILPITLTMLDVGPFVVVMGVCLVATANLYYALGIYGPIRSFVIIWRLIILDDVSI